MWIIFKLNRQLITNDFREYLTTTGETITLKYHKEINGKIVVIDIENNMYLEEKQDKYLLKYILKYTLLKYYINQKEKK